MKIKCLSLCKPVCVFNILGFKFWEFCRQKWIPNIFTLTQQTYSICFTNKSEWLYLQTGWKNGKFFPFDAETVYGPWMGDDSIKIYRREKTWIFLQVGVILKLCDRYEWDKSLHFILFWTPESRYVKVKIGVRSHFCLLNCSV